MIVSSAFKDKKYVVLGLARSGIATLEALSASGANVLAWDDKEDVRAAIPAGLARIIDPATIDLAELDGIVVSPGVPLNQHPITARATQARVPIIGDIELFAMARTSLPPHKIAGVTGTNGKSTVTALLHHIVQGAGLPAAMGGNIGLPILAQQPLMPNAKGEGVYVLELSSYQIDLCHSLDCDVAILLNITPDHLDRYDGMDAYAASKARLLAMQSPGHVAIIATDDAYTRAIAQAVPGSPILVSADDIKPEDQSHWPALQGPHNAQNVAAVCAAARALGIDEEAIARGLCTYPGLPHRMEHVAEKQGVLYINDSKATNPASAAPALAAFPPSSESRLHWILGGQAKVNDLDACWPYLAHVRSAYTIGEAGPLFARLLRTANVQVHETATLEKAVQAAARAARPGEIVLLSPAAASFDQFRDYEARGAAFRAAVGMLT